MTKATAHTGEGWDRLERLVLDLQSMSADGFRTGTDQIAKARDLLEAVRNDFTTRGESAAQVVKDIMAAVQSLRKATTEAEELQQTIAGLEKQVTERDNAIEAQKEAALQLEKRLSEQDQAIQASKQRVAELERQAREYEASLDSELSQKTDLQHQLDDLENMVNARNVDLEQGSKEVDSLNLSLAEKDKEVAELRKRIESFERGKSDAESARDALKARLVDMTAGKQTVEGEINTLRMEADGLRKDVTKLREKLQKAANTEARVAELENAFKEATDRVGVLEAQLKEETADGTKASVVEQLAKATKEQEASKKELRKLRAEVKHLKTARAETQEPEPEAVAPEQVESEITIEEGAAPAAPASSTAPSLPDVEARRWKLGEILWEMGVITLEQLEDALEVQRQNPQAKIGTILQDKGFASPEAVAQAVALRARTEYVEVDAQSIAPDVASLIPARLAAFHKCIPIRADDETVTLAMANALDIVAIEDVERVSKRRVEPVVATEPRILAVIEQVYERGAPTRG